MKNKKFTSLLLVTMLLLSFVVTGCGKSITPKECAQVLWEMSFNDISNASKLNIKEDEQKAILEKSTKENIATLKASYAAQGLTVTDEQITELYNMISGLGKRATVTIDEVSNDGKTAKVKYKTTYIDTEKLMTKATTEAVEATQALGITDQKEIMDKYSELVMQNLINEFKNATFSEETNEETYTFTKQNKVWLPEGDLGTFSENLVTLASGKV